MANKVIKGLTVEIGGDTTNLGEALKDVEKKSRDLSSELRNINKLLKLDPGNVELLTQKEKVLNEAVEATNQKLKALKEAEKQVQEQFKKGKVSEAQVRALKREIIDTEKELDSYKAAAKEATDAVKQLGDKSDKAADDVDDFADKEDKAEKEADDLSGTLDGALSAGFKTVIGLATAAAAAIVGTVEASMEYRREMGKLDTAFSDNEHSAEAAKATYKELQGVLGETDQAVEAANHLAALCDTEEELNEWTNILTGVYGKFGVSLPIEGLAEAANETKRTGTVTGGLADALNWAAKEGETFGVKMKESTEANEDWNKAVEEATTAEDYFNLALQECSTEQERQALITETLTKLYGGAATQYKKTNKAVIEANKANEEWNETLADLGEEMQPVVTDIKKMGTEILKSAKEPLKNLANTIRSDVIPRLTAISTWVLNNGPTIKAVIVGATAAVVAYKVACIAAAAAQGGLTAAVNASTIATKALNLVQAASPWGLAAAGVTALVTAIGVYNSAADEFVVKTDMMTEEEYEVMAAADEAAQAFRDQKAATEEASAGITSQMEHTQQLANELQTLVDKNGAVKEADEARVQFILNELNEALGTEYEMVDGIVQKYDELKNNINEVIQSKTANALLEANNADYVNAINEENTAFANLRKKEEDYLKQKEYTASQLPALQEKWDHYQTLYNESLKSGYSYEASIYEKKQADVEAVMNQVKAAEEEKRKAYEDSLAHYGDIQNTMSTYRDAQSAALQGDYEQTIDLLKKKGGAYLDYAGDVDDATKEAVDALYQEAINTGLEAEHTRRQFEQGVGGYTQEMVDEAERGYEDALAKWAAAYDDAHAAGTDLGGGLKAGMEGTRSALISKAKSLVSGIISAMRKEADSHSPSRKLIALGEDMGEGAEIGLENKTDDVVATAEKQVKLTVDAYAGEGDEVAQTMLHTISLQNSAKQAESYQSAVGGTAARLDLILAAIERGQILMLDGDTLVGGTADKMNRKLGQIQLLTAKGAI